MWSLKGEGWQGENWNHEDEVEKEGVGWWFPTMYTCFCNMWLLVYSILHSKGYSPPLRGCKLCCFVGRGGSCSVFRVV